MTNLARKTESAPPPLEKAEADMPALIVTGPASIAVKAGTIFAGQAFEDDTPVKLPDGGLKPGADYLVLAAFGKPPVAVEFVDLDNCDELALGGFHFAPGGNAPARAGGDDVPAINPFSLWDLNFRPACPDPRGMALVQKPGGQFWCDIYLLGINHPSDGTSKIRVIIADGNDCPENPGGEPFEQFDYATAVTVMARHGKGLLSIDEFFAAAYGVTERKARDGDPKVTGLDVPRTSRFGIMQAAGNMWVWGHDGDPDTPRASLFGGSWWSAGVAGSRRADVGYWAGHSFGYLGARGRSDHLQPV